MITRPLDLASKLRPMPRNFDAWFLVNVGLILLSFSVLGSRFVLAPGLGVDFQLPHMKGARAEASRTTHDIAVNDAGLIIAGEGSITLQRLGDWLKEQGKVTKEPALLVRASAGVPSSMQADIVGLAREAGFRVVWAAEEPPLNRAQER
ncbi:MAG TPA: biopolymer transporter ExbD [Opitutaceae bacterium]|nr:biopolymer transporter ExbD [Opitutaceae bacterium]